MVFTKVGSEENTLHVSYYETHLHKQGMIDLTLDNPADSAKVHDEDTVDIPGIHDCIPGEEVTVLVHHADGATEELHGHIT